MYIPIGCKLEKGDICWLVPIRYWETQEPSKCVVITPTSNSEYVYVESELYESRVYVKRVDLWGQKQTVIKAAKILADLMSLRDEDDSQIVVEKLIKDSSN